LTGHQELVRGAADVHTGARGPTVCLIGFGELGSVLAAGLAAAGASEVRVHTRARPEVEQDPLVARIRAAGAHHYAELAQAVRGATAIVSAVPATAATAVARACADVLDPDAVYVDLTACEVAGKQAAAELIARAGGRFVDVAVLGTVVASGYAVPMLASGPGAEAWSAMAGDLGLRTTLIEGPAGRATTVKLLRSVYMKGRDALVLETLLAARRYGLDRELLPTIAGPGEEVPFPELAERVLCSLALHAGRRADELEGSAALLREAGVEPVVTAAASERLRRLGDLGLKQRFAGQRPSELDAVLDAIDELSTLPT
jgi:3-hydroxyisobutyrate dehydrogenase-like beta-hydroxyacid dehydrogenase